METTVFVFIVPLPGMVYDVICGPQTHYL